MTSPACTVNTLATTGGVDVAVSTLVTIQLIDTTVGNWSLTIVGQDELTAGAPPVVTIDNVTKRATFTTSASAGRSIIFQSQVQGGRDVNGVLQASQTTTFGVQVLTAGGRRVLASNETTEGNSSVGYIAPINAAIRVDLSAPGTIGSTTPGAATFTTMTATAATVTTMTAGSVVAGSVRDSGLTASRGVVTNGTKDLASTNEQVLSGSWTFSSNTTAALASFALANGKSAAIEVRSIVRNTTTGASFTRTDVISAKNVSGTITVSAPTTTATVGDASFGSFTATQSSGFVSWNYTGVAATNIQVDTTLRVTITS